MKLYLKFRKGKQKDFLKKIEAASRQTTLVLSNIANISTRTYKDWVNEKYCIPKTAAEEFSKTFQVQLPEKIDTMLNRWKQNKKKVWSLGGLAYKKLYGNPGTLNGRKQGGSKALFVLREKGILPPIKRLYFPKKTSCDLAEMAGIILGDGEITVNHVVITLNSMADKKYINFVSDLTQKLFKSKPTLSKIKNVNAVRLYLGGTSLVSYLLKMGFITGNKVRQQVDVPLWIKRNKKYHKPCLRGLMDTDGGIFFHKYNVNGKDYSYRKVNFSNNSIPLLYFVYNTLSYLDFNPKINKDMASKRVWLYNQQEVQNYLSVVGSHNHRLLRFKRGPGGVA